MERYIIYYYGEKNLVCVFNKSSVPVPVRPATSDTPVSDHTLLKIEVTKTNNFYKH